jgi:hypothetical protein
VLNEKPSTVDREEFKAVCVFLLNLARDAMIDAAALRALLEERQLFSESEFEAKRASTQARWNEDLKQATADARKAADDAALHKLLEGFRGPAQ